MKVQAMDWQIWQRIYKRRQDSQNSRRQNLFLVSRRFTDLREGPRRTVAPRVTGAVQITATGVVAVPARVVAATTQRGPGGHRNSRDKDITRTVGYPEPLR